MCAMTHQKQHHTCDMTHQYHYGVCDTIHSQQHYRPTQSIMYIPFQVTRFQKKYFTYRSIQKFKILFRGFFPQKSNENLILLTRSCGTALITQHSWLLHFRQAEICLVEMICTTVVPAPKGHLGGVSP